MKPIFSYKNTKENNEDFAITPFLFGVCTRGKIISVYGLGICWGWWAFHFALAFGLPKVLPASKKKSNKNGEYGLVDIANAYYYGGLETIPEQACNMDVAIHIEGRAKEFAIEYALNKEEHPIKDEDLKGFNEHGPID